MSILQIIWALTYVTIIAGLVVLHPSMPEVVATHFNGSGPDGFMSRNGYFMYAIGFTTFMNLCFLPFGIDRVVRRLPDRMIKVPNREKWNTTTPLREEMFGKLVRAMAVAGASTNILMGIVFGAVAVFNLGIGGVEIINYSVAVVLALSVGLIGVYYMVFRTPVAPPIQP